MRKFLNLNYYFVPLFYLILALLESFLLRLLGESIVFGVRIIFAFNTSPYAKYGKGLIISHPVGIVIGSTAKIGDNAVIMPNVVIGAKLYSPKENNERHTEINDNVIIGANATIIGNIITIGRGTIVEAGPVVTKGVPLNSIYIGVTVKSFLEKKIKLVSN